MIQSGVSFKPFRDRVDQRHAMLFILSSECSHHHKTHGHHIAASTAMATQPSSTAQNALQCFAAIATTRNIVEMNGNPNTENSLS